MKDFTILTRVAAEGQEVYAFRLSTDELTAADVSITGNIGPARLLSWDDARSKLDGRADGKGIVSVTCAGGVALIEVVPFNYKAPFELTVKGEKYTKENGQTLVEDKDLFKPVVNDAIHYQIYSPKAAGPRPLILFLHGGGESGYDNEAQLLGSYGAIAIAKEYPDCFVMAPQSPPANLTFDKMPDPQSITFENSGALGGGWTRTYLAGVCDEIRRYIREGLVDEQRVYVTGLSMGGGGTIRALNVGSDLFAAGVPICPSMTPETYKILKGLTNTKVWVACAYLDHTAYRHKYIVDAMMELRSDGNRNARLTMYNPEDLLKHGIGGVPGLTLEQQASWNHYCWVPTYNNEFGLMSWMLNQRKDW